MDKVEQRRSSHGLSKTPEYRIWKDMKQRCGNPQNPRYSSYGGRGIGVCPRWFASFQGFLSDMGNRPTHGHSIDRIDNDGPYSPDNCRWADRYTQQRNKRPYPTAESVAPDDFGTRPGEYHNRRKTHCPSGHAYDKGNTIWRKSGDGRMGRHCRECDRERKRKARLARKTKSGADNE